MLDYGDFTFLNSFKGIKRILKVIFRRIQFCFCTDMQRFSIEKISFARCDFTQRPIITANIIFCGKLTVFIGRISVNQLLAFIYTVLCTRKRSVTLRISCFFITLGYGKLPFFASFSLGKDTIYDLPFTLAAKAVVPSPAKEEMQMINASTSDVQRLKILFFISLLPPEMKKRTAFLRCAVRLDFYILSVADIDFIRIVRNLFSPYPYIRNILCFRIVIESALDIPFKIFAFCICGYRIVPTVYSRAFQP